MPRSRAEVTDFLQAQLKALEEYSKLLSDALLAAQEQPEDELEGHLDAEALRAEALLQQYQSDWKGLTRSQVVRHTLGLGLVWVQNVATCCSLGGFEWLAAQHSLPWCTGSDTESRCVSGQQH